MTKARTRRQNSRSAGALVDSAWRWLERQYEQSPHERERWQAVGEALESVESRRDVLGDLASDVLTGALDAWLRGEDRALLEYLEGASPRELIEAVDRSARALEDLARRRDEQRQALLALARSLGAVGVKLLLGALLAL
jgi:hypothetical protein